jgi:hypothetical protein
MATGGAAQFGGEGCVKGKGFAVGIADEDLLWARREGGGWDGTFTRKLPNMRGVQEKRRGFASAPPLVPRRPMMKS